MEARPLKKRALSDLTNYLKSSSLSYKNPKPNTKPFNLSSSSIASDSLDLDFCSDSETSIGSSSFNDFGNGRNHPKKAQGKTKDKERLNSMPLIIYSGEKTSVKGNSAVTSTGKTKDTLQLVPMPASYTSMVNIRNKIKKNVHPFSLRPVPRSRKKRAVSKKTENICVSSSYSASHSDHNKKKNRLMVGGPGGEDSVYALPQEYVEEQLAYFKEIDDFVMAEEVVSENWSDNEDTSMGTLTI